MTSCLSAMIVKSSFAGEVPFTKSAFVLHAIIFKISAQFHVDDVDLGQRAWMVSGVEGLLPN